MDPGVMSHGMKADPPGYLWSKYECFPISGWWDIFYVSCLNVKLWSNSTNGTEVQTNERTNIRTERQKLYTLSINAGGIINICQLIFIPFIVCIWPYPKVSKRYILLQSCLSEGHSKSVCHQLRITSIFQKETSYLRQQKMSQLMRLWSLLHRWPAMAQASLRPARAFAVRTHEVQK